MEAPVEGNVIVKSLAEALTSLPKLITQTNSIVSQLGMSPSTTLPSAEDAKIESPSGITSFLKKITGTE